MPQSAFVLSFPPYFTKCARRIAELWARQYEKRNLCVRDLNTKSPLILMRRCIKLYFYIFRGCFQTNFLFQNRYALY
jgi:hypothetical protein